MAAARAAPAASAASEQAAAQAALKQDTARKRVTLASMKAAVEWAAAQTARPAVSANEAPQAYGIFADAVADPLSDPELAVWGGLLDWLEANPQLSEEINFNLYQYRLADIEAALKTKAQKLVLEKVVAIIEYRMRQAGAALDVGFDSRDSGKAVRLLRDKVVFLFSHQNHAQVLHADVGPGRLQVLVALSDNIRSTMVMTATAAQCCTELLKNMQPIMLRAGIPMQPSHGVSVCVCVFLVSE
jgi:hypothetical protein